MVEEENNILDFYKEEYPDNYEVSEDKDESSWSCSCKDSIFYSTSSAYARILTRLKSAAESPISKYPQLMLEESGRMV